MQHLKDKSASAENEAWWNTTPPSVVTDVEGDPYTPTPQRKLYLGTGESTIPNHKEITMCSRITRRIRIVMYVG